MPHDGYSTEDGTLLTRGETGGAGEEHDARIPLPTP